MAKKLTPAQKKTLRARLGDFERKTMNMAVAVMDKPDAPALIVAANEFTEAKRQLFAYVGLTLYPDVEESRLG